MLLQESNNINKVWDLLKSSQHVWIIQASLKLDTGGSGKDAISKAAASSCDSVAACVSIWSMQKLVVGMPQLGTEAQHTQTLSYKQMLLRMNAAA